MKKQKELEVVTLMISIYCKKKHGCNGELCADCAELLEYVKLRRNRCPWGDNKPFCSSCKIHCYIPKMRKRIKDVMRFSGPRMLLYHPVIAIRHMMETQRQKKKMKKEGNKNV